MVSERFFFKFLLAFHFNAFERFIAKSKSFCGILDDFLITVCKITIFLPTILISLAQKLNLKKNLCLPWTIIFLHFQFFLMPIQNVFLNIPGDWFEYLIFLKLNFGLFLFEIVLNEPHWRWQ